MGNNFKENLIYLRSLNKWTQQEISDKLGIKRSTLGAYEEDRANPSFDTLIKICEVFFVSVDDMLIKDLRTRKRNYTKPSEKQIYFISYWQWNGSTFLPRWARTEVHPLEFIKPSDTDRKLVTWREISREEYEM